MNFKTINRNQYLNFLSHLDGGFKFKSDTSSLKIDTFNEEGEKIATRYIESKNNGEDIHRLREDYLYLCVD